MRAESVIEGTASYGIGGGTVWYAWVKLFENPEILLHAVSSYAHHFAIIFGCVVVLIRAIHDGVGLYRRIKGHK